MLRAFLLVGLGGAAGSVLRYALTFAVQKSLEQSFPFATLLINITGCFLIGLLFGLVQKSQMLQADVWLVLATGFCGGFTTFSAFALENVSLLEKQQSVTALVYSVSSVALGILICKIGIWLVR